MVKYQFFCAFIWTCISALPLIMGLRALQIFLFFYFVCKITDLHTLKIFSSGKNLLEFFPGHYGFKCVFLQNLFVEVLTLNVILFEMTWFYKVAADAINYIKMRSYLSRLYLWLLKWLRHFYKKGKCEYRKHIGKISSFRKTDLM